MNKIDATFLYEIIFMRLLFSAKDYINKVGHVILESERVSSCSCISSYTPVYKKVMALRISALMESCRGAT